jgi:GT2 family glycosyltransferase
MVELRQGYGMSKVGIVVIGRNEGERLRHCLLTLVNTHHVLLYIDSASDDGSLEMARQMKVNAFSISSPHLSAALARNEGAKHLFKLAPDLCYIQFVDGDTILSSEWLQKGEQILDEKSDVAVTCGDLNEKDENFSFYKIISGIEWKQQRGEVACCGGNCMVRASVFFQLGGFNISIPAGEDSEFCYRVRKQGWKVFHSADKMGEHESSVNSFWDYWKRCKRTGYAYQQISLMYKNSSEKLFIKDNLSNWIYGGIIPIGILVLIPFTHAWSLWVLCIYPLLAVKIFIQEKKKLTAKQAFVYSLGCIVSKFPGFIGACSYLLKL